MADLHVDLAIFRKNLEKTDKKFLGHAVAKQIRRYSNDVLSKEIVGQSQQRLAHLFYNVQTVSGEAFNLRSATERSAEDFGRRVTDMSNGTSHAKAIATYFWFHVALKDQSFADAIDSAALEGKSYSKEFAHTLPKLWLGPSAVDASKLVRHFEAMFEQWDIRNASDHAENAYDVIQNNVNSEPFEYEESIISEAQRKGLFEDDQERQVFENRVRTGAKSFESKISIVLGTLATNVVVDEPQSFDPQWVAELSPNFENPEFINEQIDVCKAERELDLKKLQLLDVLDANLRGLPYTDAVRSPVGLLNSLIKANQAGSTKNFLMLAKAKYLLLNGNSEDAINTFEEIVGSQYFDQRQKIDAHYNFLNASFGLRLPEHYGTEMVSTQLRDVDLPDFDAHAEIGRFCSIYGIDPENSDEQTIFESTSELGASAAKIIYFYNLERILRSGTQPADFTAYLDQILTMLRVLSNTRRPGQAHGYYIKESWYPLVFLYTVSYQFGHYESMEKLDHLLMTFEGWPQAKILQEDVQKEFKDGNLLTLIHQLNRARYLRKSGRDEDSKDLLVGLRSHFYTTSVHPAISQTLNFHLRDAGLSYDEVHDTASQRKLAVSHRNYIIDFDNPV